MTEEQTEEQDIGDILYEHGYTNSDQSCPLCGRDTIRNLKRKTQVTCIHCGTTWRMTEIDYDFTPARIISEWMKNNS